MKLSHNLFPLNAYVGDSFNHAFLATGGIPPYTFFKPFGMLPPGLKLDAGSGNLSGVPTTKGSYTFTLQALDGKDNSATLELSITIKGRPLFT